MIRFIFTLLTFTLYNCTFGQIKFDPIKLKNSNKYGSEIANLLETKEVYEFKDTNVNTLFLQNGFRSSDYLNGDEWLKLSEENEVYRIDVIYSKYPLKNGIYFEIYPLLFDRLNHLFMIDNRLNSSNIEWNKILQTNCQNNAQVNQLMHGILIWYRPINEFIDEETIRPSADTTTSLSINSNEDQFTLDIINTNVEAMEQLHILLNSNLLTDSIRNAIKDKSTSEQQQTVIELLEKRLHELPSEDLSKIDKIKRNKYEQELSRFTTYAKIDIVDKVLNRHPEWKDILVVNDWTGSMYGYGSQVLKWHLNNLETSEIINLTLFNDGDKKNTDEKIIGETNGIYTENANNIERLIALFSLIMMKGCGGDGPENDIEAILKAIELSPGAKEIVLIADNNACIRDILLSNRINIPVRVIACGVKDNKINPDLAYLAKITGGGIYLIEEDIEKLAIKIENEKILLGDESRFTLLKSMCSNWLMNPMVEYHSLMETKFKSKKKIQYLDISNQQTAKISKKVYNFSELIHLDMSDNELKQIDKNIANLVKLKYLNLSNNQLNSLPTEFNKLSFLTYLNLSNNKLRNIPVNIMEMEYLDTLLLANNQFKTLPKVTNLNRLKVLDISGNELKKFPAKLSSIKELNYLNAANNDIIRINISISRLTHLEYLDLSNNKLIDLPIEIKNLQKLKVLHLEGNDFKEDQKKQILEWLPNTKIFF